MEKQEARSQNEKAVMFCNEGSFLTFYDMDALIINRFCGYKIIPSGTKPKTGVPLNNTTIFSRLEKEGISYFVYKKGEGIVKEFVAPKNLYDAVSENIVEELKSKGLTIEKYFSKDVQLGRNNKSAIQKTFAISKKDISPSGDTIVIKKAIAMANDQKFDSKTAEKQAAEQDKELEIVTRVPADSSDLVVFTAVKKLTTYVILVTEKSPKHFRGVFVNRMQNYCIECLELLFKANLVFVDSESNFSSRQTMQAEAVSKLKLLGYIAVTAESVGCILPRQFKQISILMADAINLITAWRKSDAMKWKEKRDSGI